MQTPLDQAILVLLVGMCSVFIILGLIVLSGQVLIRIINHFFPVVAEKKLNPTTAPSQPSPTLSVKQLAALTATVETITRGQGRIVKIEKKHP